MKPSKIIITLGKHELVLLISKQPQITRVILDAYDWTND